MTFIPLKNIARHALEACLSPGDIAIDATVGNGHDALFISRCINPNGHLFGFDIQQSALHITGKRLADEGFSSNTTLIQHGHESMLSVIPLRYHGKIKSVCFNLGYLPGGNKSITTTTAKTLAALDASTKVLSPSGCISVTCYPGHDQGSSETQAVCNWHNELSSDCYILSRFDTPSTSGPILLLVSPIN